MNIKYDSVKSYINRHFEFPLLTLTKCNEYVVGTLLYPLDSMKWTNATITHIDLTKKHSPYTVLTDFGNVIHLSKRELIGMYGEPKYKRDLKSTEPLPDYHDVDSAEETHVQYQELLKRINNMWLSYMAMQGYEVIEGTKGWESVHPMESSAWGIVCSLAADAFPGVDINEVIEYADQY